MKHIISVILLFLILPYGKGQTKMPSTAISKKIAPKYNILRAHENYNYLKIPEENPYKKDFFDPIKFISLNSDKSTFITLGGELRTRIEFFENKKWKKESLRYFSQRLSAYSNFQFGKKFRFFAELYHGFTSHTKQLPEYDEIDFHQLFLEYKIDITDDSDIALILGRQELVFGSSRLVTLREGPNIRQDFDLVRSVVNLKNINLQVFYGKEVRTQTEAFDNSFTLLNKDAPNAELWGLYSTFNFKPINGSTEIYYIGFHSEREAFSDIEGEETRHTLGLRRFGKILDKRFKYNTELIYQFGDNDGNKISAFNIETDWNYLINTKGWKPTSGLKLVYTSGDKNVGDGKLGTFNPLYASPNVYNLSSTLVPINIISIHPSIRLKPSPKWNLLFEYVFFWRSSLEDHVYSPPGVILRQADNLASRNLGGQVAINWDYYFSRHLTFNLSSSYYITGTFQETTGPSENIFHIAPTMSYKF